MVRKVCGLGDMILTIPWLLALRRLHPHCLVHLLGHAQQGELLRYLGVVEQSFPDEGSGWHRLFCESQRGSCSGLRPDPCDYDHVYLFSSDSEGPLACALREKISRRLTTLPASPLASESVHASWVPFRAMNMEPDQSFWQGLEWPLVETKPESFLVHPGSGSAFKNWPPEKFARLVERISECFPEVTWRALEGPCDQEAVQALRRFCRRPLEILRPSSLCSLASELRRSLLFLGNDSGVTHLAGFMGVPTLALFGPSDPFVWAPMGKRVRTAFGQEACEPCHLTKRQMQCQEPCRRFPSLMEAWEAFLELRALMPA